MKKYKILPNFFESMVAELPDFFDGTVDMIKPIYRKLEIQIFKKCYYLPLIKVSNSKCVLYTRESYNELREILKKWCQVNLVLTEDQYNNYVTFVKGQDKPNYIKNDSNSNYD